MSNISELESINSACNTPKELIKSEDFIRGITIILEKVKTFNKDYILSLFTKLKNNDTLDEEEKEDLNSFVSNSKVSRLGQELLSKLRNVSVDNTDGLTSFSELLNGIFAEDGFKKIQSYVGEVANIIELTLPKYEDMERIIIELNGEKKEVYIDEKNLRVDSSEWKIEKFNGIKVKINPEGDIIEYLEGKLTGEQYFNWYAAMRESEKQGKRLPFAEELQAVIEKVGVKKFYKNGLYPGHFTIDIGEFGDFDKCLNLWTASSKNKDSAYLMFIKKGDSVSYRHWGDKKVCGESVRCFRDLNFYSAIG